MLNRQLTSVGFLNISSSSVSVQQGFNSAPLKIMFVFVFFLLPVSSVGTSSNLLPKSRSFCAQENCVLKLSLNALLFFFFCV